MDEFDAVRINTQTAKRLVDQLEPIFSASESYSSGEIEIAVESTATVSDAVYCVVNSPSHRFAIVSNPEDVDAFVSDVVSTVVDDLEDWAVIYDARGILD